MFEAVFRLCIFLPYISGLILPLTKSDGTADLTSILSHITLLEQTVDTLHNDTNRLQIDLRTTNERLQLTQADLNITRQELQTSRTDLQVTRTDLNITRQELQTSRTEIQATKVDLQHTQTDLQTTKKDLQTAQTDLMTKGLQLKHLNSVSETSAVAFQVFVSSSYNVTSLDPVVYDSIIYDTGSGYNTTTGMFTAPVNGTYMFWIQLGILLQRFPPSTSIKQSGKTIGSGWAAYSSSEGAVSATCVSHLQKDEEVWVQFEQFRGDIPITVTVRSGSYVGDAISFITGHLLQQFCLIHPNFIGLQFLQ
ncbi:uncharacterized protein LOC124277377 [Haliotis rubra]|uniref:uncharacterized protein LOC124277377 n=1 Tax=Haliotis rubra TaxID=36100 RepID=UPI001EE5A820|nr:uncharacterized protein LOC124277377 [Haliotis rubra]